MVWLAIVLGWAAVVVTDSEADDVDFSGDVEATVSGSPSTGTEDTV